MSSIITFSGLLAHSDHEVDVGIHPFWRLWSDPDIRYLANNSL